MVTAPRFPEFSILVAYSNVEHAFSLYVRPADVSSFTPQKLRRFLLVQYKYIYIRHIRHILVYTFYSILLSLHLRLHFFGCVRGPRAAHKHASINI